MPRKRVDLNALTEAELFRGLVIDHAAQDVGGGLHVVALDEQTRVEMLHALERLVSAMRATDDPNCWIERNSRWWPALTMTHSLDDHVARFQRVVGDLQELQRLDRLEYSPSVELFARVLRGFKFPKADRYSVQSVSPRQLAQPIHPALALEDTRRQAEASRNPERTKRLGQKLLVTLREELLSKVHRHHLSRRKEAASQHYKAALALFEELFSELPELLVVRADLGYLPGKWPDIAQARDDMKRFWNGSRSSKYRATFSALAGYIKKLEFTYARGYHFHLIFVFNPAAGKDVSARIQEVGQCWNILTKNRGTIFDSRNSPNEYSRAGIGRIHREDSFGRTLFVRYGLEYLTMKDQYLRVRRPGARGFETSQLRSLRTKQRKEEQAQRAKQKRKALFSIL